MTLLSYPKSLKLLGINKLQSYLIFNLCNELSVICAECCCIAQFKLNTIKLLYGNHFQLFSFCTGLDNPQSNTTMARLSEAVAKQKRSRLMGRALKRPGTRGLLLISANYQVSHIQCVLQVRKPRMALGPLPEPKGVNNQDTSKSIRIRTSKYILQAIGDPSYC